MSPWDLTMSDQQPDGSLAALLCALSFATSIGLGERMEHGLRSAYIGLHIADNLNLSEEDRAAVFYGALLKDVGCTACGAGLAAFFPDDELAPRLEFIIVDPTRVGEIVAWLSRAAPRDRQFLTRVARLLSFFAHCGAVLKEAMRGHCEVAVLFARQLGLPAPVQDAVHYQFERWDGRGMAYGLRGDAVPIAARILHAAQVLELACRFGGPEAARALARERAGERFDPAVAAAFLTCEAPPDFWEEIDEGSAAAAILAMQPPLPMDVDADALTDRVCEAVADFVDLKVARQRHSRTVATVAEGIGLQMGLADRERAVLRRAALVHDVGKVAVPFGILAKGGSLSESEQEQYRLHPYYTQRILERVPALRDMAGDAASHHEWINGEGYHRQLRGEQIPLNGRILAVANEYARRLPPDEAGAEPESALREMRPRVGRQFDDTCYQALVASVRGSAAPQPERKRRGYGELTAREVEVLGMLVQGLSNPQIAEHLSVSRKTIEHHLEHIYNKLGLTCRTAAVVYAVQQGIA